MTDLKIDKGIIATLNYTLLNAGTGQTIGTYNEQDLLFGYGLLLDGFEKNLLGYGVGERFSFELAAADAYGEHNPGAVVYVPIENFADENGNPDHEALQPGHVFPMGDARGNRYYGKIIEILPDKVKMDFNHHLAGFDLLFTGQVIRLRPATTEEIQAILQQG
ncbi:MAG TPA: peptidylprolyl isomerase [Bacteroidales bacterium]|nr:peptidylprolyl isomerase [Bacteroidales bacterium]